MADAGAEFNLLEEVDAVRMVWNVWPYSRLEAAKCVIPFGVMYTPAKQTTNLQVRDFPCVILTKSKTIPIKPLPPTTNRCCFLFTLYLTHIPRVFFK